LAIAATGTWLVGRAWRTWSRRGRPAVLVAALVPVTYAVTRIAWVFGIPLGVRQELIDELGSARWAGLGLALFALLGAWLTTGLISRWGEVFWSWLPLVGGRRVPVSLAVAPALFVAAAVAAGGVSFWSMVLRGQLDEVPGIRSDWAAWAPELLWPVWAAALAVAALAYLGRRRGEAEARLQGTPTNRHG
jgi:hypothetical protein